MVPHVTTVCKSHDTCKTLIHAFITAWIDYCKSLLYGQAKCILRRLQCVLNSTARLIYPTSRHEHITPLLILVGYLLNMRYLSKLR